MAEFLSITDRIRNSGDVLNMSYREISDEIYKFYKDNNELEMRSLFEAYFDWERKNVPDEVEDDALYRCKHNLDSLARYADNYRSSGGNDQLATLITRDVNVYGLVTKFYRKVVNYTPSSPRLN